MLLPIYDLIHNPAFLCVGFKKLSLDDTQGRGAGVPTLGSMALGSSWVPHLKLTPFLLLC